jgi:hypothetical protein
LGFDIHLFPSLDWLPTRKPNGSPLVHAEGHEFLKKRRLHAQIARAVAFGLLVVLLAGFATVRLNAQESQRPPIPKAPPALPSQSQLPSEGVHRFWDKTNLMLFAGVATVRTLDYTSTRHFRSLGHNEVLLTNSVVDNKPLFAGIEVAGMALSIGAAYWLHRTGHHKLERWVSVVHIGAGAFGDIRNYSLGKAP